MEPVSVVPLSMSHLPKCYILSIQLPCYYTNTKHRHAMNPADGQSASFAFEDAVTLALLFKQEKTRIDNSEENDDDSFDLDSALRTYSQQRIDRCIEMQRRSEERAAKAMKGDNQAEDVSKWIYDWEPPISDSMECNE